MTDQDAKDLRWKLLKDTFCIGSVWGEDNGLGRIWQVFHRASAIDKFGDIIYFTEVHRESRDASCGMTMTVTLARSRLVPLGIMPLGTV
jgi:hypothetical protein